MRTSHQLLAASQQPQPVAQLLFVDYSSSSSSDSELVAKRRRSSYFCDYRRSPDEIVNSLSLEDRRQLQAIQLELHGQLAQEQEFATKMSPKPELLRSSDWLQLLCCGSESSFRYELQRLWRRQQQELRRKQQQQQQLEECSIFAELNGQAMIKFYSDRLLHELPTAQPLVIDLHVGSSDESNNDDSDVDIRRARLLASQVQQVIVQNRVCKQPVDLQFASISRNSQLFYHLHTLLKGKSNDAFDTAHCHPFSPSTSAELHNSSSLVYISAAASKQLQAYNYDTVYAIASDASTSAARARRLGVQCRRLPRSLLGPRATLPLVFTALLKFRDASAVAAVAADAAAAAAAAARKRRDVNDKQ